MIASLTGKPSVIGPDSLLIDVSGVGYRVIVSPRILSVAAKETTVRLWIHTHVREDMLDLFGFLTSEELTFFKILLTISGIGPRTALAVLNFDVSEIKQAVVKGDVEFFSLVPRLGKKNAQKIIIELRPKLGSLGEFDLVGEAGSETQDVIAALTTMGFSTVEARSALGKLPKEAMSVGQKIKEALKVLGK